MTSSVPPDSTDERTGSAVSQEAVRRLAEAVARLSDDSQWFVEALTDMLLAMTPISEERLTMNEAWFLIESGDFTAEQWFTPSTSVEREGLHLDVVAGWVLGLLQTKSLEDVVDFLGWNEEAVLAAVGEGSLYAIEISGRLRFPSWQFIVGSSKKLLPGLTEIIEVVTPQWHWRSVAGFMATPEPSLVAEGQKTPIAWLRDGGDVNDVRAIIEASMET